MSMGRNAAARSLLQSKISNSKGAFNPHTGKLKEEEGEYIPKPQREKEAVAKATPSLRSQGQPVEVVRDTGLKSSLKATMEKRREAAKAPRVNINTDRGFVPDSQLMRQLGRTGTIFTKSTAKDEKTRLYETNDSLLNPQEIMKKYSYVAQDKDMDYGTLRRAVNKGMQEIGRTLRGTNDNSQYERVAKLQTELQGRLKSASFTAGLLEGMGGAGKDAAVRLSGNEALQKQNEALKAQMAAAQENNRDAAAAGQLAGELAKAGAGYMTIGKAAESLALKGAEKLGQRMAAATAADGAQKLAAKVLFDPKKAKAAGFATRMLAQQAADTAVNTPITILNGTAEGKSRKEILRDFGKQEATDAAFNLGLAGLGAGAKALGKAKQAKAAKAAAQTETAAKAVAEPAEAAEQAAKETAAETGNIRQETIQGAAAGMAEKRNVLAKRMSREEIKALETEYANLQSAEYKAAKLQEVSDATGGDPAAIRNAQKALEDRKLEIEKILTQQEALRTNTSIIKDVSDEVMGIFNLRGKKRKEQVQNALRQLIAEAEDGKISEERRNSLFEKLFSISGESRTGTYGLKKRLREKKLILSVEGAADIPDINEWNKAFYGKLGKIKTGQDSNIDAFYRELSRDFPGYFPEGIDREADQLLQMRKIAEKLQGEIGLEKSDYQENFNRTLDRLADALDVHMAYAAEVGKKAEGFRSNLLGKIDYGTVSTAEVEAWNKERWRLQEIADGVPNDLNATEKHWLEGMLNGDITEVQAKKATGPRYALIKQQYDVQKPLREIEEKIKGFKEYVSAKRYSRAGETIGEMRMADGAQAGWKDKGTGFLYGRETQERNLRDIAPDKETADRIEQVYFAPIHENERQRTLLMKEYKNRLKGLKISTRKNIPFGLPGSGEKRCSESALVQWLGESRYELQRMKAAGATEESYGELEGAIQRIERGLHPKQLAKINEGIEQLRSIYEELHPMINEVLIRNGYDPIGYIPGYFPHMNFDDPTGPLETAAAKLGFDFSSKELPMDIAGRTEAFRPGKRWAGNFLQRTGTKTDYDALRAFDLYIDNISDVIYHTDDIRNLRSMEDYIRYSLSDEGIQKEIEAIRKDRSLTPEEKQAKLDEIYETRMQNHKLQNYVSNLRTYTDLLAGKKHPLDRPLETQVFGRKAYKAINEIENRVAGNMVAANIGSALTNFIPITQGMSNMRLSSNLKGLGEALIAMGRGEMDELTKKSAFLATREGTEQLYKTTMGKISDVAGKPMEWADKFSTQAVWRSRYYDNLAKGMAEEAAIKNADEFARGLFAGRSKGAMPTLFSSKAAKPLTMFQLEVNNQISYLTKDIPREAQGSVAKMMKAYGGLVIGAYIYNDVYEKLTGRRSALDPFGIANEAFGDLTGEQVRNTLDIIGDLAEGDGLQLTEKTEKQKPSQVITGLTENIGENVPFLGGVLFDGGRIPMKSAIPSVSKIAGAFGDMKSGDASAERSWQTIGKEMQKPLWYLAMPTGGGQLRKTTQGLNLMRQGGSYNQTNEGPELQYAVDTESKGQWAKASIFGKWATDGAKGYLEKDRTLGVKQTETYEKLVGAGAKNTMAFETINRMRNEEKSKEKRRVIRSSAMNEEQKAILYHSITTEDSADRRILDHYQGTEHMGKAADCLMRMADYHESNPQKNVLLNTELPDEEKKYIYLERLVDKDNREKEGGRIDALMGAGISMNDYIQIRTSYGTLYTAKDMKIKEKKQAFISKLNQLGLSAAQQAAVKEQFIFGGGYTSKW